MNLKDIIRVADGRKKADLLLTNTEIVNVFSGEIIAHEKTLPQPTDANGVPSGT